MGDSITENLGLVKPLVGASRSTWGNKWNGNADEIDGYCNSLALQIAALEQQVGVLDAAVAALEAAVVALDAAVAGAATTEWCIANFKPIASYTPNQNVDSGASPQWFVGNFANSISVGGFGISFPPYGPHYFDFEYDGGTGGVYVRVDAGPTALIGTVSMNQQTSAPTERKY